MIFGNIKNLDEFSYLSEKIKECFDFYKNNDKIKISTIELIPRINVDTV